VPLSFWSLNGVAFPLLETCWLSSRYYDFSQWLPTISVANAGGSRGTRIPSCAASIDDARGTHKTAACESGAKDNACAAG
jgi:hypothetical protein